MNMPQALEAFAFFACGSIFMPRNLFVSPDNSAFGQIVGRKFDGYFISWKATDKGHSQLSADACKYNVIIFQS